MSKHTEGPWTIHAGRSEGFAILAGERIVIPTEDEFGHFGAVRNEADAQLIAAAPDLLAALGMAVEALGDDFEHGWLEPARAALAKATGEAV